MGKRILYSIDVPDTTELDAVLGILSDGEKNGTWIYQESHRGHARKS